MRFIIVFDAFVSRLLVHALMGKSGKSFSTSRCSSAFPDTRSPPRSRSSRKLLSQLTAIVSSLCAVAAAISLLLRLFLAIFFSYRLCFLVHGSLGSYTYISYIVFNQPNVRLPKRIIHCCNFLALISFYETIADVNKNNN